jgi:transposase
MHRRCILSSRTLYARLLVAGKRKKVALTACMHTLLTILNAILQPRTPWREPTPTARHRRNREATVLHDP